jgi:hypothetical protein
MHLFAIVIYLETLHTRIFCEIYFIVCILVEQCAESRYEYQYHSQAKGLQLLLLHCIIRKIN